MRQVLTSLAAILMVASFTPVASAGGNTEENPNAQCQMISALTGDFYANKQDGLSKEEARAQGMPEFANASFLRTADLALNMAYAFDEGMQESEIESQVYQECLGYQ